MSVGEDAGTLETTLQRLAAFKERSRQFKSKQATALLYPAIVLKPNRYFTIWMSWRRKGTLHPMRACPSISDWGTKNKH